MKLLRNIGVRTIVLAGISVNVAIPVAATEAVDEDFDVNNLKCQMRVNGEIRQDFTTFPFRMIEQAPHRPTMQPMWVPVRPSSSLRK